jgi:hypothetical protein
MLADGFGPGSTGPLLIAATLPAPSDATVLGHLASTVRSQPGVASVSPPRANPAGTAAVMQVHPATSPQAAATGGLVHRLRDTIIPRATAGIGVTVYVGGQYTSKDYAALARANGVILSVSRKGECWDNAVAESFFATLKRELVSDRAWPTRAALHRAVFDYIEGWYNTRRLHSSLGYLSPAEYELAQHSGAARRHDQLKESVCQSGSSPELAQTRLSPDDVTRRQLSAPATAGNPVTISQATEHRQPVFHRRCAAVEQRLQGLPTGPTAT